MGRRYNPDNFIDRGYMDFKFAELKAELITYFDSRLRALQEGGMTKQPEPPAERQLQLNQRSKNPIPAWNGKWRCGAGAKKCVRITRDSIRV